MIIFWKKVTPLTVAKIKESEGFIAIITHNFIKDKKKVYECQVAESLNKPMYAIVEKGINWDRFEKFPWRKTYILDGDLEAITMDIKKDLEWYKSTGA